MDERNDTVIDEPQSTNDEEVEGGRAIPDAADITEAVDSAGNAANGECSDGYLPVASAWFNNKCQGTTRFFLCLQPRHIVQTHDCSECI